MQSSTCIPDNLNPLCLHTAIVDSNNTGQPVVIKSARHFRIVNERDAVRKFQSRTPHLRPLIDEVVDPVDPPAIVQKHLEDGLPTASIIKKMSGGEISYVSKRVLGALNVDSRVYLDHKYWVLTKKTLTDIKIDNIMMNYASSSQSESGQRFKDVQLGDLESTVHIISPFCKNRDGIGTLIWRSPEAQLRL